MHLFIYLSFDSTIVEPIELRLRGLFDSVFKALLYKCIMSVYCVKRSCRASN